jgi:dienelactone hydrolase
MRKKCVALGAVLLTSLPLLAAGPRSADPSHPGEVGPYAVGHLSFVIEDPSRNAIFNTFPGPVPVTIARPIPVHVFYPVDAATITPATPEAVYPLDMIYRATHPQFQTTSSEWEAQGLDRAYQGPAGSGDGPFPLVMFSPGWGAAAWSAIFVGTRLASHGFVVAILYHYGDRGWSYEPPRDHLGVASLNRPLDVSFALTHLLARNGTGGDALFNLIDPGRVAASGWSLGGYAAMALAAGDDSVCDKVLGQFPEDPPPSTCVPVLPDPRIRAIAPLDGSTQLLWFHELERISVPTLGIGQEWSAIEAQDPAMTTWQARLHLASQGKPAYRVDVTGVRHVTFSNMCQAMPILLAHSMISPAAYPAALAARCGAPLPIGEAHRIMTQYLVAFLKANLANEAGYQSFLTPGYALTSEPAVEFFVTERANGRPKEADWPDTFYYFAHQPGSVKVQGEKNPKGVLPVPHLGLIDR